MASNNNLGCWPAIGCILFISLVGWLIFDMGVREAFRFGFVAWLVLLFMVLAARFDDYAAGRL